MKKYTAIQVRTERDEILAHLLRLSKADRYLRFCHTASDEAVMKYVDNIDLRSSTEAVFAVFGNNQRIVAMCHIAPCTDIPNAAEIALSVDEKFRQRGVGRVVFKRGMLYCESLGIKNIHMNCLASNLPIQRLVRGFGVRIVTEYGESEANMKLKDKNAIVAFLEGVQNDTIGQIDLTLRHATHQWVEHINKITSIITRHAPKEQKKGK